jgi:hypothetical protein
MAENKYANINNDLNTLVLKRDYCLGHGGAHQLSQLHERLIWDDHLSPGDQGQPG